MSINAMLDDMLTVSRDLPRMPSQAACGTSAYRAINKLPRVKAEDESPVTHLCGIAIITDPLLPDNVIEMRDRNGKVLQRIVLA